MSTDPKTLLETIGANMRSQLKDARADPFNVPLVIPAEYNLEFGTMCIRAVLEAGLRIQTTDGEWVVLKETPDDRT